MIRYILRRLLLLIPVIILVSFIVFALMDLAPGDAMSQMDLGNMTVEEIAELRAELGLDDPLFIRYGRYMGRLIQGDLGSGDHTGIPVWDTFIGRLPNTLLLALVTVIIGVSIALPLGIFAAKRSATAADSLTTAFTIVGMSMPGFWLGILLMLLFAHVLGWLPAGGFNDGWRSLILPGVVSAMPLLAACTRQTRSSMLEVLKADYLRTARAKGVPENVVIRKHALGNALIPIVTTIGVNIALAVSGTAVIEQVFAWPGVGRMIIDAVMQRDVTTTTSTVILTTVLYVIILLAVDVAYAFIDPRIRAAYVGSSKKKARTKDLIATTAKSPELASISPFADTDDAETFYVMSEEEQATHDELLAADAQSVSAQEEFVSFATVSDEDFDAAAEATAILASGESVSRKYRKRSRGAEVFRHVLKNKGAVAGLVIIGLMLVALIASLFFIPFESVTEANIANRNIGPGAEALFGTDHMGRDLFTRVIYATRFSLPIGFGATVLAAFIGILLGSLSAYYDRSIGDEVIMRVSDAFAAIPGILLGMVIITTLGRSVTNIIIAIGISAWPVFARVARASVLTVKGNEFVEAAKAIGVSNFRILFTQVLPNGMAPLLVVFSASLGMAILISAGLSFLGFGIPVPNPEWGQLVSAGRDNLRDAPWLTTFPGLFIMGTVMAFNLLGDGLRDAFDPKLKK